MRNDPNPSRSDPVYLQEDNVPWWARTRAEWAEQERKRLRERRSFAIADAVERSECGQITWEELHDRLGIE